MVVLLSGCVTRTLTIDSSPPGADVFLDGRAVGTTPYSETFLSYGVRRVDLRLPGHDRLVAPIDVERPWWQYPPFSLFADLLVPYPIHDVHNFSFQLTPLSELHTSWAEAEAAYARLQAHKRRMAETWPELADDETPPAPGQADAP